MQLGGVPVKRYVNARLSLEMGDVYVGAGVPVCALD